MAPTCKMKLSQQSFLFGFLPTFYAIMLCAQQALASSLISLKLRCWPNFLKRKQNIVWEKKKIFLTESYQTAYSMMRDYWETERKGTS